MFIPFLEDYKSDEPRDHVIFWRPEFVKMPDT